MIGSMKDRITAKKLMKTSNGRGGWILKESEIGTYWGNIETLNARNTVQFRQADLQSNTQIIMRFNDLIDRETVLYARGKKYTIEEALEEEKGFLTIVAVGERLES